MFNSYLRPTIVKDTTILITTIESKDNYIISILINPILS